MNPEVTQHLEGMRKAMLEIVLPEVGDKPFAAEQATLIVATLGLLVDVQQHQDAYVRQESLDYRSALQHVLANFDDLGGCSLAAFRARLQDLDRSFAKTVQSYAEVQKYVQSLKAIVSELLESVSENGQSGTMAILIELFSRLVDRQIARELSWQRMTGFDPLAKEQPNIGDLLLRQAEEPCFSH